jgi:hypothetical protein
MELPLDEERIRAIVAHLAHLRAAYGEAFAAPDLVEPNSEYFPDELTLSPEGIGTLLRRMLGYAPVSDDLDVQLGFIEPDGEVSGGGCGSVETADGYAALVHVHDVGDPTILTTALARAIGRIVLFEAGEEVAARDEGPLSELTAVAAGFGLLLLNGACVYKKGCGGMKRHQATFLDVEEIAMALALFVRTTNVKPGVVRRHVEITQKEAFNAALAWVDGQPSLVRALVESPETLEDGIFAFEEKKGLLSRLFSRNDKESALDLAAARPSKPRERSPEELRRLAEAKALVDEALSET